MRRIPPAEEEPRSTFFTDAPTHLQMASAPSAPVGDKIGAKDDARDHRLRRTNTIKEVRVAT